MPRQTATDGEDLVNDVTNDAVCDLAYPLLQPRAYSNQDWGRKNESPRNESMGPTACRPARRTIPRHCSAAIEAGTIDPARIVTVLGKTEGNGCVNDFTRDFATRVMEAAIARCVAS
jgi:hypothetical protein